MFLIYSTMFLHLNWVSGVEIIWVNSHNQDPEVSILFKCMSHGFCAYDLWCQDNKLFSSGRGLIKRVWLRKAILEPGMFWKWKWSSMEKLQEKETLAGNGQKRRNSCDCHMLLSGGGIWTWFGVTWVLILQGMRGLNLSISRCHQRINICKWHFSREEARMEGEMDEEVLP